MKVLICSLMVVFSFQNFAQAKSDSTILSYYEFSQLDQKKQATYLKGLRDILVEAEEQQKNKGMGYQTAQESNRWMFSLISSAIAADPDVNNFSKGASCPYAGWISGYSIEGNKYSCENKWSKNCGDKKQIECNPSLFANTGCVAAGDGATKRCVKKMKEKGITDADVATFINAENDRAKQFNDFKTKYDALCVKGAGQYKEDFHFYSCNLIKKRMGTLAKNVRAVPAETKASNGIDGQVVEVKGDKEIPKANTQSPVCGSGGPANTCVKCPPAVNMATTRAVNFNDIRGSKYGNFIETMAAMCGTSSDSLAAKYGNCSQIYKGDKHITADEKKLLRGMVKKNDPTYTEKNAFEYYYGFTIDEAKKIFCENNSDKSITDMAKTYTSADFSLDMGASQATEMINSDKDPVSVPSWAVKTGGEGVTIDLQTFQKTIASKRYRNQFAQCVDNKALKSAQGTVPISKTCTLKSYDSVSAAQMQALKNEWDPTFGVCVQIEGSNKPPQTCTYCNGNKDCNCNTMIPEGKRARVSSLVNCNLPENYKSAPARGGGGGSGVGGKN